jgi:membrane associated rhomboid family serine protease
MARISYSSAQGLYELDLCQTCQMLWFDRSEVDQFGASFYSETSDADFKQKSRHAKDRLNIESLGHQQIAFDNRPTTDTWSLLVGVLGLPREINPTPTASKSLATWSLIIIISLVTLTTYFNPQAREFLAAASNSTWYERSFAWTIGLLRLPEIISLLVNLYFFSLFGDNVEDAVGPMKFMALFMVASILVTGTQVFGEGTAYSSLGGCQGGIAAIIGFYATRWPNERLAVWPIAWLGPVGWVYMLTSFGQGQSRFKSNSHRSFMRHWQLPVWGWFALWVTCLLVGGVWMSGHHSALFGYQVTGAALGYLAAKMSLRLVGMSSNHPAK